MMRLPQNTDIRLETRFARTAWSHQKVQISSRNVCKIYADTLLEAPQRNSAGIMLGHPRTSFAQSLHIL